MKKLLTICTAGIMVLASAFTSLAQNDRVIDYSDAYTVGEYVEVYMPGEETMSGTVDILDNADFTFSINKDNLFQIQNGSNVDIHIESVWLAEVDDTHYGMPITQCPFDEDITGIPAVKEVRDGVYSLEGLDIKPDTVYVIVVEAYAKGNAGSTYSREKGSRFKIRSSADNGNTSEDPGSADNSSDNTDNNSGNSGNGGNSGSDGDIQYFWRQDDVGWWVERSNGTYLISEWYYYPTNGLWYYMGADGYMVTNTVTPDGFTVNADGVWIP